MSVETKELTCSGCGKGLEPDTKFCPFCRAKQEPDLKTEPVGTSFPGSAPPGSTTTTTPKPEPRPAPSPQAAPPYQPAATYQAPPQAGSSSGSIVLRPSAQIWDFTEREDPVPAGTRRPLLVLDEQRVHLSHTDRKLEPQELLQRIQAIIAVYEVPVRVTLEYALWQSDRKEQRPRIVAALADHAYSDYKMILGVDYMGRWASIKMYLAVEPPILPHAEAPKPPAAFSPILAYILGVVGVICLIPPLTVLGIGLLVGAYFAYKSAKQKYDAGQSAAQEQYQKEVERQKEEVEEAAQIKSLFRTYKIDDMRLFASAMNVVFQAVINDIVQKDGAKVERIEGGKGGFLSEDGVTSVAPAPKKSDAADVGL